MKRTITLAPTEQQIRNGSHVAKFCPLALCLAELVKPSVTPGVFPSEIWLIDETWPWPKNYHTWIETPNDMEDWIHFYDENSADEVLARGIPTFELEIDEEYLR